MNNDAPAPSSSAWAWTENPRTRECHEFAGNRWDVDRAKRILGKSPREVHESSILPWVEYLMDGLIHVEGETASSRFKLDVPIIVGILPSGRKMLLDGWHRVKKAHREGKPTLPTVYLTSAETLKIHSRY
jgi:hypothetical protein